MYLKSLKVKSYAKYMNMMQFESIHDKWLIFN